LDEKFKNENFLFYYDDLSEFILSRQGGTMVTYGGMSKKPVSVSTSSFIFKVRH